MFFKKINANNTNLTVCECVCACVRVCARVCVHVRMCMCEWDIRSGEGRGGNQASSFFTYYNVLIITSLVVMYELQMLTGISTVREEQTNLIIIIL